MRKQILLAFILVNIFCISKGQSDKLEYGLQGGLNLNTAYGNAVSKDYVSMLTGLSIGGYIKFRKTEHWGLKVILSYDQNGWAYHSLTFQDNNGTGLVKADVLFRLNYLNMPVLAEYSFGNKVKLNVDGGIFFGALLNNKVVTEYKQPLPPNQESTTRSSSNYRKATNFGVSFGFGVKIPILSKISVCVDMRNSIGLFNIEKSNSGNSSAIKTNCFSILTGLTYRM